MPFSHAPAPEPIHTPPEYGLTEVGAKHASAESLAERFADERNWWIASTRADGRPHSVPIWGVVCEGHLLFGSDPNSLKTRNMAANPEVVVHLESGDLVCILEATVQRLAVDDIPATFVADYKAKYDIEMDLSAPGAYYFRLEPKTLITWNEADFVDTAARWRFAKAEK